jgi:trehalose 6-phosphate synthase/phosphatase
MQALVKRLVIASNRLPIVLKREGGRWRFERGSGGLVTALAPVLRDRGGLWIGWPGTTESADLRAPLDVASSNAGFTMKAVPLDDEEVDKYYIGLANEVIWPLFHDLQALCNFDPSYWEMYRKINSRFAAVLEEHTTRDDFVWVHDYHLINVAQELRAMKVRAKTGFFLHIPFPPPDIFFKLPWRADILSALLAYDIIGFQTFRDRRNFIHCIRSIAGGISLRGKGQIVSLHTRDRSIRVGYFPISIDFNEFNTAASSKEVADAAWYIHEHFPRVKIILGVDRLDYTKGIPDRLRAFRVLLERHPELHRRVSLVQVVVPSRRDIPEYRKLKEEIDRLVSEVNSEFTRAGWVPIHYVFRSLKRIELLAYYRTAEIALITPLKDGMNIVAKEYCASNIEETGVLILSEFAGSCAQLGRWAITVNPYHIEEVAAALHRAYTMDESERTNRMKKLRQSIRRYDIYWWVNSFLEAAIAKNLDNFPHIPEYIPRIEIPDAMDLT